MKMNCKDTLKEVLSEKRDNSITAEHLAACPGCSKAVNEWDTLKDIKGYPFEAPPDALDTTIRQAAIHYMHTQKRPFYKLSPFAWKRIALVGAAAACWVLVTWVALPLWKGSTQGSFSSSDWSGVSMETELFKMAVGLEFCDSAMSASADKEQSKDHFDIDIPELM